MACSVPRHSWSVVQNVQGNVFAGKLETCSSVPTWHVIHMLRTSCVKIELMKLYNQSSMFCLLVLSRLRMSWSTYWCLMRKICEFWVGGRGHEFLEDHVILILCFRCFSSWHVTDLKRIASLALFSSLQSTIVCYQTSFSAHRHKSNVIQC